MKTKKKALPCGYTGRIYPQHLLLRAALDKAKSALLHTAVGLFSVCSEFMDGWRRYKREILGQRDELLESERLQVEVGDGEVRGDAGGLGGR